MSKADLNLADAQALRDAAKKIFLDDLRFVRADLDARGIGGRIADRLGDSALDVFDEAVDYAGENKGTVAAVVAAVVLWFARAPILHGLAEVLGLDEEQDGRDSRSAND